MGKGKKKTKGNKRKDSTIREASEDERYSLFIEPTREQKNRARLAAYVRTEDPLKNWTRLQNEECPICMLPLPLYNLEVKDCVICGTTICTGCVLSSAKVHIRDGRDTKAASAKAMTCPLCRSNNELHDDKATLKALMKRVDAGQHDDICRIGQYYFRGEMALLQDKAEGLRWYHRAVEAGSGHAAFNLGGCYLKGDGVEQDMEKALEYFQKSAELGFIPAFSMIGNFLMDKGDIEEGMLNYRKAAICGLNDDDLFNILRDGFAEGYITKDEYAFTLRENQKACNEMKSDGRKLWKSIDADPTYSNKSG